MDVTIRRFREGDAEAVAALTLAAIRVTGSRAYSAKQIAAWAARHPGPERFVARAAKGDLIRVAVDDADCPIAYCVLEADGHVDMLYSHPDHAGRGLGRLMLAEAELAARALDITRLFTEASELARPVFERAGYRLLHRRDFTIGPPGAPVAIHNYAMEKRLA
jgi:putative acetyltransferase